MLPKKNRRMRTMILKRLHQAASNNNRNNILSLVEANPSAQYLDLGCNEGSFTIKIAEKIGTENIHGVEFVDDLIGKATENKISVQKIDLNCKLPFSENTFDVITANQVIEHIFSIDIFMQEIYRILKPNGYTVISTENASSWHNIFASILGWQIFSLTNFSKLGGLGNPLGFNDSEIAHGAYHVYVLNYFGLRDFFNKNGFIIEKIQGAGYYPFPAIFGNFDRIHAAFITFKLRKPGERGSRRS